MPVYDYCCEDCGPFEKMAPLSLASEDTNCPSCVKKAPRYITAPFLASTARNGIVASERNERAQHEPLLSSQQEKKHVHGPGCGCSSGSLSNKGRKTVKNAVGDKMFPSARPWMISH